MKLTLRQDQSYAAEKSLQRINAVYQGNPAHERSIRMPFPLTPVTFSLAVGDAIFLPIHLYHLYPRLSTRFFRSLFIKIQERYFPCGITHRQLNLPGFDLNPNQSHHASRCFPQQHFPCPPGLRSPGLFSMAHECIPNSIFRRKTCRD